MCGIFSKVCAQLAIKQSGGAPQRRCRSACSAAWTCRPKETLHATPAMKHLDSHAHWIKSGMPAHQHSPMPTGRLGGECMWQVMLSANVHSAVAECFQIHQVTSAAHLQAPRARLQPY